MNNQQPKLPGLYVIGDRKAAKAGDLVEVFAKAFAGGLRLAQLREKDLPDRELLPLARAIVECAAPYGAKLLVNRSFRVALESGAAGLHIGQKELSLIPALRDQTPPEFLIGVSTHSLKEALCAQKAGADFVTLGPAYATPSKAGMGEPLGPSAIAKAQEALAIPVFALGGIDEGRLPDLRALGIGRVALIRAVVAADDPQEATTRLLAALKNPP